MSSRDDPTYALALPAGTMLDHYQIQGTLGCGSFGVTYRAYSQKYDSACVIKELLPSDFTMREATTKQIVPVSASAAKTFERCRQDFMREATILHAVSHPHVVKILDFFQGNGTCYFVMPFAAGCTLEHFLRSPGGMEAFGEEELLYFIHKITSGLEAVHAHGYLHRDLKPENILIMENGEPLLIDFGAARQLIASKSRVMTAVLTVCYAPFEQYGSAEQGPYTDIYAFGAVLHRILTGRPPVDSPSRLNDPDPHPSLTVTCAGRGFSNKFLHAVDWALARDAKARPQNIAEWRSKLPKTSLSHPDPPPQTAPQPAPAPPSQDDVRTRWPTHHPAPPTVRPAPPTLRPPPLPTPRGPGLWARLKPVLSRPVTVMLGALLLLTLLLFIVLRSLD